MSISMTKGQKISLNKDGGGALTRVTMGLGWDAIPKKGMFGKTKQQAIDLDASCVLFDANGQMVDAVWYRQLRSNDGSIQHTGDNVTGEGDGDDEQIIVDLPRVPAGVQTLVFTVNNYSGPNFNEVQNAFCRIVDGDTDAEIARYDLSAQGAHQAMIMAKLYRHNGEWKMAALGNPGNGRTFQELLPSIHQVL